MVMTSLKPRINSSYCPGAGDKGVSKMTKGKRSKKASPIAYLYSSVESLQLSLAEVILHHRRAKQWPFLRFFGIKPIQQEDAIELFEWLEQALFSLSSFCHCLGDSERHMWPAEFESYLNEKVIQMTKKYARSDEFQSFSTHSNLFLLNKIRVCIRKLEIDYRSWASSLEIDSNMEAIDYHARILNRLSGYLWCVLQKERVMLKLPAQYWVSSAPEFNLIVDGSENDFK